MKRETSLIYESGAGAGTPTRRERCWNNRQPFAPGYWTYVREYRPDGRFVMVEHFIEHRMTRDCQQPGPGVPPAAGCVGCRELKTYD